MNVKQGLAEERELPPGWGWVSLGNICEVATGGTPDTGNLSYYDGAIAWMKSGDVKGFYIDTPVHHISPEGLANSNARLHPPGTVLLAMSGQGKTRGSSAILRIGAACSQSVAAILPSEELLPETIHYWLMMKYDETRRITGDNERSGLNLRLVRNIRIPIPPLAVQKRIVGILNERMAAIDKARAAAEAQLEAAKALPAGYLREAFPKEGQPLPPGWRCVKMKSIGCLLPSKSISTEGEVEVLAVTTACLTEGGFDDRGIKTGRMKAQDVSACVLEPGEILIARSNTAELVGRAALYRGSQNQVVASDLTIRIKALNDVLPDFLARYLSLLFISGYWRSKAGGASGSMKKITRPQIEDLQIPLCSVPLQEEITASLDISMESARRLRADIESQLCEINSLPAALLRQAFNGSYDHE